MIVPLISICYDFIYTQTGISKCNFYFVSGRGCKVFQLSCLYVCLCVCLDCLSVYRSFYLSVCLPIPSKTIFTCSFSWNVICMTTALVLWRRCNMLSFFRWWRHVFHNGASHQWGRIKTTLLWLRHLTAPGGEVALLLSTIALFVQLRIVDKISTDMERRAVVKANCQSNGKGQISTPHISETT